MAETIRLTAADGHGLGAYRAEPKGPPKGGLVIVQEIFGVTGHIREVCDGYAADGYIAVAPALFDRLEPDVELAYDDDGTERGRGMRTELGWDRPVADIAAAVAELLPLGPVGVVGYCWGGSLAWLAATRIDGVKAAIGYYGGQIVQFKDETPRCPVLLHFGRDDALITPEDVAAVRAAQPEVPVHVYPAGHGFNCTDRADYDPQSAALARERSLEFLARHLLS